MKKIIATTILASILAACGQQTPENAMTEATASPAVKKALDFNEVFAEVTGFTVGSKMAATKVIVIFDPQCIHCATLWESSKPLLGRAEFTWVPVSLLSKSSGPQAATILESANPAEAMATHEKLLTAKRGGIAVAGVKDETLAAIAKNTELLKTLGAEAVPYLMYKHPVTGELRSRAGGMPTSELINFLGLPKSTQ